MNKKGFTLVEIIVCLVLIVGIGVGSILGVKQIKRNIVIDELSKITDKILAAAEVYIETDKETHDQIYNKRNAAVIPLKTLVNEGLVDLSLTTLEDSDVENEYVLSAFTSNPETPEGCVEITNTGSWTMSSSAPIYICANGKGGSGGSGNLTITTNGSNYERVTTNNAISFFDNSVNNNYIEYNGKVYRILQILKDDSLILVSKESFGNTFDNLTEKIDYWSRTVNTKCSSGVSFWDGDYFKYPFSSDGGVTSSVKSEKKISNGEALLSLNDMIKGIDYNDQIVYILMNYVSTHNVSDGSASMHYSCGNYQQEDGKDVGYKIHLKNCMKITSRGTGTETNPYILENYCS